MKDKDAYFTTNMHLIFEGLFLGLTFEGYAQGQKFPEKILDQINLQNKFIINSLLRPI